MEDDELGVQEGKKPSTEQQFFQQKYREMKSNSPDKHDDLAKSFITTVGMLATIYFGGIAFSKIAIGAPWWFKTIAIMPIVSWLLAVISALIGLLPREYPFLEDVPESVKDALEDITKQKYKCVRYCGWLTLAGLAMMMITLVLYVFNVG